MLVRNKKRQLDFFELELSLNGESSYWNTTTVDPCSDLNDSKMLRKKVVQKSKPI